MQVTSCVTEPFTYETLKVHASQWRWSRRKNEQNTKIYTIIILEKRMLKNMDSHVAVNCKWLDMGMHSTLLGVSGNGKRTGLVNEHWAKHRPLGQAWCHSVQQPAGPHSTVSMWLGTKKERKIHDIYSQRLQFGKINGCFVILLWCSCEWWGAWVLKSWKVCIVMVTHWSVAITRLGRFWVVLGATGRA